MISWRRWLIGVGLVGIAVTPVSADAQTAEGETPAPPDARSGLMTPYVAPVGPFVSPPSLPSQFWTVRPAIGSPHAGGQRGGLIFTPSLTVSEEYNDNVFSDNRTKRADLISVFSPGVALSYVRPTYRLGAAYSFSSLLYANESQLNAARGRELLTVDMFYQPTRRLTLTAADAYVKSETSTTALTTGVATPGLTESKSNVLSLGSSFEVDARTFLRSGISWSHQSFGSSTVTAGGTAEGTAARRLQDADTYSLDAGVERDLTRLLKGSVGYSYSYFDISGSPPTQTHSLRLGASYQFTRTIAASASAGPQFVLQEGDVSVGAVAHAGATKAFSWGYVGLSYDHSTTTSGGIGGTATTTAFGGQVEVNRLKRGLTLAFSPRYSEVRSDDARNGNARNGVDVKILTLPLQASYSITPWLAVSGGYSFLQQRSGEQRGGGGGTTDVDQNRLFVSIQLGYPLRFD